VLFRSRAGERQARRACGFLEVGVHRKHGKLDGAWKDTVVVERLLGEAEDG